MQKASVPRYDIVIDAARLQLVKLGMTHRLSCHCADAFQTYLARSFVTICTDLECSLGHEREPREKNAKSTKGEKNTQKLFVLGRAYGNVGCRESRANVWGGVWGLGRD